MHTSRLQSIHVLLISADEEKSGIKWNDMTTRLARQLISGLVHLCNKKLGQRAIENPVKEDFWGDQRGQTLVLAALCMTILVAMLGLSIDAGMLRYQKRQMQNLADASALAGALEISACAGTSNCTSMQTAVKAASTENGLTANLLTNCATRTGTKLEVTLNNPPCALSSDPNTGSSTYVETVVSEPVSTVFANLLGVSTVNVLARAEATKPASPCVYLLSQYSSQPSLSMGNQTTQTTCPYYLGLSYSFTGGATSSGSQYYVAGSSSSSTGTVSPTPIFGVATMVDPLSTRTAPTVGSNCTFTGSPYTVSGAASLKPGTYFGGLTIKTSSTVTLASGTYIILGALTINGPTLNGSGVTFYITQNSKYTYGAATISNVDATMSAPTSGSLQGILYFSDPTLPTGKAALTVSNWNPDTRLDGILYLPGQELIASNVRLEGNNYFGVVSDYCTMNNTAFYPSADYSSLAKGTPFTSTATVAALVQ